MNAQLQPSPPEEGKWEMKELKPWHKHLCSMLAQGIDRQTIATILDCAPEYVSMLARQPKIQEYMKDLSAFANIQLEAQFTKAVTVIGDTLENGNYKEKMQAARLQMEATKRIGPRMQAEEKLIDTNARLAKLAERLLCLQDNARTQPPITVEVIQNEEDAEETNGERPHQSAQEDGNGLAN